MESEMADPTNNGEEPVIVKKYANRRLYNTRSSSYITLDDLARMTREGIDFKVLDAKTGNDITHSILTQIIMEEEAHGEHMLPVGFLRQLISMYGNSMQAMMPQYLEASMDMVVVDCSAAPELREGDWLDVPYHLPDAASRCGMSQYELLTTLGRRFRRGA